MKRKILTGFILSALVLLVFSCDIYEQDSYREYYVVESYLIANADLPQVKVSKTVPIDQPYSFDEAALDNASVTIEQVDSAGAIKKKYGYHRSGRGVYRPDKPETVKPRQRYKLQVIFANGDSISAETLVPGDFHPVGSPQDTAVYQSSQQVAVNITPSFYPDRQSYFIFSVDAVDPSFEKLTPFYADAVEDDSSDISDYYINSSGIINEKNYSQNSDGTITIKLPWLAVAFYGQNEIVANTIDDNMYDFVRTQDVQTGGSTLPPGQIQNVQYHVKGGIGILGSMASDTISVFIKKPL